MADRNDDALLDENVTLSGDLIQDDVVSLLQSKFAGEEWNPIKVDGWVNDIIGTVLKQLAELKQPFKYVVHCVIMQKTGAPLSTGFISLWDNTKDGVVHVPYENDMLHCLLTVFFVKLN